MKRFFSMFTAVIIVMCAVFVTPTFAATVEDLENTGELSALFDFEENGHKVRFSSAVSTWQKDATHSLSYYNGSWTSGSVMDNPVKGKTDDSNSIVNNSNKVLGYRKTSADHWSTAGGSVLHIYTENGPEPVILENGVTYKISFDYMVESTHRTDEFVNSSTGSTGKIGETVYDFASVGYGYRTTSANGFHPLATPKTVLGQFFSYSENTNQAGTYMGDNSQTLKTGNWYHIEYTFTPQGLAELDFSQEGTVSCPTNAPFIMFYISAYSGTSVMLDNITLQREIEGNFNAMGGTLEESEFKGFYGEKFNVPTPVRYGYDFAGWYKDGALKEQFTDAVYTKEIHGGTLYAKWDANNIGFESYTPASSQTLGSKFSVSSERAASGNNSLKYNYKKSVVDSEILNSRTGASNLFTFKALEDDGIYKITFKYYIEAGGADVIVYPVTVGTDYNDSATYKAYNTDESSVTVSSDDSGEWRTAVLYFTAKMLSGGNNVGLHVHALSNVTTVVYFDDISIVTSNGGGHITLNAGDGTVNGEKQAEFFLDYGSELYFENLYCKNSFVEGYYYDSDLTEKCKENVFTNALNEKTLYVKWSNTNNLEYYEYKNQPSMLTNGFELTYAYAKSFKTALKLEFSDKTNLGNTALAAITEAEKNNTYLIEFYYYTSANTSFEIKPVVVSRDGNLIINEDYEGFTVSGLYKGWKKAAVAVNIGEINAEAVISLAVTPEAGQNVKLYFDDITVTVVKSNENYVIFDTVKFDGQRKALYGVKGTDIGTVQPENIIGMNFEGWYTDKNFETEYIPDIYSENITVYAGFTEKEIEKIKGDANADGAVDAADLAVLKKYLAGYDTQISTNADIDGNGKINAVDLVLLYKILVNDMHPKS